MNTIVVAMYIMLLFLFMYFTVKKKYLYVTLIFILFGTAGFDFLPAPETLSKTYPILSLTFFCLANLKYMFNRIKHDKVIKMVYRLCMFFIFSIIFSLTYWGVPFYAAIHEGLPYMIFMSILIFSKLTYEDCRKLLKILFYITFITTIMFVIQSLYGKPILASAWNTEMDRLQVIGGKIHRFYIAPQFITFFIFISIFYKELIPKSLRVIAPIVFLAGRFCTMHRSAIMATMAGIVLLMWLSGSIRKNFKVIFVFMVIFLLFGSVFEERVKSGNNATSRDLRALMSGNFDLVGEDSGSLTLMYRIGWFIERGVYLLNHPVELVMGMPLSNDKEYYARRYNFKLGLVSRIDGYKEQVTTPDIGYGMMETRYGLIGTFLLMGMVLYILKWLYKHRHKSELAMCLIGVLATHMITTLAGVVLADPKHWIMFFVMFVCAERLIEAKCLHEPETSTAIVVPNTAPKLA